MNDQFALYLIVIFFGGIVSTVSGGGLSMILIIFGTLFVDVRTAIVVGNYVLIVNQAMKALHFGVYAKWNVVLYTLILGIPATYIGGLLLFALSTDIVRVIVAVMAVVFVSLKRFDLIPPMRPTKLKFVVLGGLSGILGGLMGNGAIIRKPVFAHMGLTKEVFLGTTGVISLIMSVPKLIAYIPNAPWNSDYTLLVVSAIPILFVSIQIAKRLLRQINAKTFELLLHSVIVIGAIRLLFVS